jgi:hypothetical protein
MGMYGMGQSYEGELIAITSPETQTQKNTDINIIRTYL